MAGRDLNIGYPEEMDTLEKIALALQILIDQEIKAEDV